MSVGTALWIFFALLLANAFFVAAEFSVISVRRSAIEPLVERGTPGAKTVLYAMEHVSQMLATAQIGITVASIGIGMVAEPSLERMFSPWFAKLGMGQEVSHTVALVVSLLIVMYLHVVFGEMIPKNLSVSTPERAVMWFGPPLVWISRALKPIIWFMDSFANLVLRLFGIKPQAEVASAFTAEEVQSIVERSQAEGLLDDAQGLLSGALEFTDKDAADVMVNLEDVVWVERDTPIEDIERVIAQTGYSRLVVKDEGQILGYLHLKDLLSTSETERKQAFAEWRIRRMPRVVKGVQVEEVLAEMQRTGSHLALVVKADEEPEGVVFLEDILEELVGEVRDSMQLRNHP